MNSIAREPARRPLFRRRMFWVAAATLVAFLGAAWGASRSLATRHYHAELARAEADFRAGFSALAQQRLTALAVRWPRDAEIAFRLGICEKARGRREAAMAAWSRVPARSRFGAQAAALRGYELTGLGRYTLAEQVLETALRDADSGRYDLSRALIRLYMYEGRVEDARRLVVASWSLAPDPAGALKQLWALDTTPLPMDGWQRALDKADPDDDRVWLGRAHLAILSGRFDEADDQLAACLKRRPDDPVVWQASLRLARARDVLDRAWAALAHLPACRMRAAEILELRAWLAAHRGDTNRERRELEALVQEEPGNPNAWERLADLASQTSRTRDAERLHRRKAEIDRAIDQYRKIVLYEANLAARADELAGLAKTLGRHFDARAWSLIHDRGAVRHGPIGINIAPIERSAAPTTADGPTLADLLRDQRPDPERRPLASSPVGPSPPVFRDDAERTGLRFVFDNGETAHHEIPETMAGGVAVLDYDNDGWLDVYAVQGGPLDLSAPRPDSDHLFRNNRDGTFHDVTNASGVASLSRSFTLGVTVGDYDNDGRPDLFLSRLRSYALFRNRGDGTFEDATVVAGLVGQRDNPSSAAFADLDNDGDLDLYVTHYMRYDPEHPRLCPDSKGGYMYCDPFRLDPAPDHVFRNDGGRFVDVTSQAGFTDQDGRGLGVVAADFDGDNRVDLFVANDGTANYLFRNLGGFRFEETAHPAGVAAGADGGYHAGMGVACGDLDRDGRIDLLVTNFYGEASVLYFNLGGGLFTDRTAASGLGAATRFLLGFGTSFLDYDNNGWIDLLTVNGHVNDNRPYTPFAMPVQLLAGDGAGRLTDVSSRAGVPWNVPRIGRGLATGDLDNDGRIDAVVLEQQKPLSYFHNQTAGGHFLTLRLEGTQSNRDGVGARISITAGGRQQVAQRFGGGSYQSSGDPRLHFGLGPETRVERVEVRWPSGRLERFEGLEACRGYLLREGAGTARLLPGYPPPHSH